MAGPQCLTSSANNYPKKLHQWNVSLGCSPVISKLLYNHSCKAVGALYPNLWGLTRSFSHLKNLSRTPESAGAKVRKEGNLEDLYILPPSNQTWLAGKFPLNGAFIWKINEHHLSMVYQSHSRLALAQAL